MLHSISINNMRRLRRLDAGKQPSFRYMCWNVSDKPPARAMQPKGQRTKSIGCMELWADRKPASLEDLDTSD